MIRVEAGGIGREEWGRGPFSFLKPSQSCSVFVRVVMDFCLPVYLKMP